MAILYAASDPVELAPLANRLAGLRKLKWPLAYAYEGVLEGRRVVLVANGAGPKLGAQAVEIAIRAVTAAELSSSRLEAVVSTGFCGALDPTLREFQIVRATEVLDFATGQTFPCDPVLANSAEAVAVVLGCQDRVAMDAAEKQRLAARGAQVVDMESVGVAARAQRAGLPFCCIKAVSDRADEAFALDFNRMRTPEGRISRTKIVLHAVTHPQVIPHLFRLKRRMDAAAEALAQFLLGCRIKSAESSPPQTP